MTNDQLLVDRNDAVAVVTLNRPDKLNALSEGMWSALAEAFTDLDADPEVRAVILTGAGKSFCAGSDISDLASQHDSQIVADAEDSVARCRKPVIAAISGYCLGGGLALALACDLRLASTDAKFGVPPATLGIVYPHDATRRLMSLIGPSATKYLIYTADRIDAVRAYHIGLVDELASPDLALVRAGHVASKIAAHSQLTVQATKEIVDAMVAGEDTHAMAERWIAEADAGPDLVEGIAAFGTRRRPQFTWMPPARS